MSESTSGIAYQLRWLALPMLALWLLIQGYSGLWHDSELYSFQAMAHLHPDLLGNDLYLRFGSQDQYSLFPRLYAALIQLMGLENAAETLTIFMQLTLLVAVWRFAAVLFDRPLATLALACVLAMPSGYGSGEVFHYLESFVTPRMAAEALALFALAGWFAGRRLWPVALWIFSCVLHPLIGLAAAIMVVWHMLLNRRQWLAVALALAGAMLLLAARLAAWRMDDVWLSTIRAGIRYLLLADWKTAAFALALHPLLMLGCANLVLEESLPRSVAAAALLTGVSGLALSFVGGDLLHLTAIIQSQPWRWMWLAAVTAAIFVPRLVLRLWSMNALGRSAAMLLAAIYYVDRLAFTLAVGALFLGVAWLATRDATLKQIPSRWLRIGEHGAQIVALFAVCFNLFGKFLAGKLVAAPSYVPPTFAEVYAFTSDGALPLLLLLLAIASWYWALRRRGIVWWYCVWALVVVNAALLAEPGLQGRMFPPPVATVFAKWQRLIPPRTEIFIPEDALAGWAMLLRPSYFTLQQSASELFSRPAAMELRRRASAASAYLSRHHMQLWPELAVKGGAEPTLAALCASTGVGFVVTRSDLSAAPLDTMPDSVGARFAGLKLYACPLAQKVQSE